MIVDHLSAAERYFSVHPGFRTAFEFLRRLGPDVPVGRHVLDGERLFVLVSRDQGRGREKSLLESHRRYIDIQYVVEHTELIGWLPTSRCERIATPYAVDKDIGFFYERPQTWLEVPAGYFAVFFPADSHAPLATTGPVVKAVAKVAVDW